MTKLFLGVFDIAVSLFLWVPFAFMCLAAVLASFKLIRHRFSKKNLGIFAFSMAYIAAFSYLYIYRPDALAPVFCMVTCLVPVMDSSRKLHKENR